MADETEVKVWITATVKVPVHGAMFGGGGGPVVLRKDVEEAVNSVIPSGWNHELQEMNWTGDVG